MKLLFASLFLFIRLFCYSQNISEEKIKEIFCTKEEFEISKNDLLDSLKKYDFSLIWLTGEEPLGFIGDNYQRFFIHFDSVKRNTDVLSEYSVLGKTMVKNNICSFQGKIEILSIKLYNEQNRIESNKQAIIHNDVDVIERTKYQTFILIGKYSLYENIKDKYSGTFNGFFYSTFYVKDKNVFLNDLEMPYSDSYSNNQFVGTWKSYNENNAKRCNWGLFRIPCAQKLDIGAGFFSPELKFIPFGWKNYYNAYVEQNEMALKMEKIKWWEK